MATNDAVHCNIVNGGYSTLDRYWVNVVHRAVQHGERLYYTHISKRVGRA
jgi:hypothetical protein